MYKETISGMPPAKTADGTALRSYMSNYGRTSAKEAYAEAFSAFRMTGGQTTNPLVQMYADRFGWKAPSS